MKRYPILSFFILALIPSSSIILLIFLGLIPSQLALSSVLFVSLAGMSMTAILEGKAGLNTLFSRLLIWRIGFGYWLFAIFFVVPIIIIGSLFNPLIGGDPVSFTSMKLGLDIIPLYIGFFILAGLGQELGWAGFLLPRLQGRFNAFTASLIRGLLVFIWHLPLLSLLSIKPDAIAGFPYGSWIAEKGFLVTILVVGALSLPWSIFSTWIFNNTRGSVLLVAVLHGSEIWLGYLFTRLGLDPMNLDNYWGYGILMILASVILFWITGPENLSRRGKRITI